MYAIAIVRYRRPLEEVLAVQEAHRAFQRKLKEEGTLLAAGPHDPRFGGMFLLIGARLQGKKLGMDAFAVGNLLLGSAYVLQLLGGSPG